MRSKRQTIALSLAMTTMLFLTHSTQHKVTVEEIISQEQTKLEDTREVSIAILPSKDINSKDVQVDKPMSPILSRGGSGLKQGKKITIEATAYDNDKACTGKSKGDKGYGITTVGTKANYGTIAVPKEISLGTKIYIPALKQYTGTDIFIASDRGGAIIKKGSVYIVDVWMATHSQALEFGRQRIEGYILEDN